MSWLSRATQAIAHHGRIECRHCLEFYPKGAVCRCIKAAQAEVSEKAQVRLIGDCAHFRAIIKKQRGELDDLEKTHDQVARRLQLRCERLTREQAVHSAQKYKPMIAFRDKKIIDQQATIERLQLAAGERKKKSSTAFPGGCKCQGCDTHYSVDLIVPDGAWEKIKPLGKPVGAGLLCPDCIMSRLGALGWGVGHLSTKPIPPEKPHAPVVRRIVNEKVINHREAAP